MTPLFPNASPVATITPCALTQARMVLRDPATFADHPSLCRMAQLVAASTAGTPARQSKLRPAHPATATPTGAA